MLQLSPFGTVTTSEASQKAEEFPNAKPFGGRKTWVKAWISECPESNWIASVRKITLLSLLLFIPPLVQLSRVWI